MAVPTITSISPDRGPTGGRQFVTIIGTNFQLPPAPASSGPTTPPNPSVEVLFGTAVSPDVRVVSSTLLHVITPICALADAQGPTEGDVDVVVRNIDQDGVLVPGETATEADGYTYARPDLKRTGPSTERILTRITRQLLTEFRRQLIDNVQLATNTDYGDPDGYSANVAALADIPGIVLTGPRLRANSFYRSNVPRSLPLGGGRHEVQRAQVTYDLLFAVIGVDDNKMRCTDLLTEVVNFVHRNTVLRVPRAYNTPDDLVDFEFDFDSPDLPTVATRQNSNLHAFGCEVVIRGVDIDDASMATLVTTELADNVSAGAAAEQLPSPIVLTGQAGVSLPAPVPSGPSPGIGQTGLVEQIPPEE